MAAENHSIQGRANKRLFVSRFVLRQVRLCQLNRRLTLLRSPVSPKPSKDPADLFAGQGAGQGLHDFTYSMYPHAGGWREAGTERTGCLPIVSTMRPQHSLQ
jgi:alpha-mannosidase